MIRTSRMHHGAPAPLAAAIALAFGLTLPAHASGPSAGVSSPRYAAQMSLRKGAYLPDPGRIAKSASPRPAGGATLPVSNCLDDGSPGSLRAVVASASDGDTIDMTALACGTITLTQGPIDTSILSDDPLVDVVFQGPGRDELVIEAAGDSMTFLVGTGSSATGHATFNDLTIANSSYSGGLAACVNSFGGTIELNRATITNCHASGTVPLVFGGAVNANKLILVDSTISDSSATGTGNSSFAIGGGAYATDSAMLVRSTISGNAVSAPWSIGDDGYGYTTAGGGLYTQRLAMTDSTIAGNSVESTNTGEDARGGGIFVRGVGEIESSTIEGNSADGSGGGIYKEIYSVYGDPPPPQDTKLYLVNSTLSGNTAASGGGLAISRPLYLSNSTIAFNHATDGAGGVMFLVDGVYDAEGKLDAQSSIIASNTTDGATHEADFGADGAVAITGANNLVVSADATLTLPAGTLTTDPLLAPLAWNGGATRTHALLEGSPALDAGNNAAELDFDQRGENFARVAGTAADIGAFERQGPVTVEDRIFADGFDPAAATATIEHVIDDGDGDTNQGPPSSFDPDMLWGNYFTAQPGGEFVARIQVAFGPTFPSLADGPVTFWVLQDPDNDGDPRNAYAVGSVEGVPDVFNDDFFEVQIPPTFVSGGFFVGASAKLLGGQDKPARVDTDGDATQSWFFYAPDIAATIDDLAAAPFGTRMDDTAYVIYPGVFMIRAEAEAVP